MIPRIFYQTYKSDDLPPSFEKNQDRWLATLGNPPVITNPWVNPIHRRGWTYVFLDDDGLRDVVKAIVPHYLDQYDDFSDPIERVDFARYCLMYMGGVYADMDTYPLQPIDGWLSKNSPILGCEPSEHANDLYNREVVACNAFMMSPPKHSFWMELMDYIVENYVHNDDPVFTTGPMAITKFLESRGNDDVILGHPCLFFPLTAKGVVSQECASSGVTAYVVHEWANSWTPSWWRSKWLNVSTISMGLTIGIVFVMTYLIAASVDRRR